MLDERFAVDRFAVDRFAVLRFRPALLFFAADRFAVPRFAVDFLADDFFADDFFAVDFFAEDFFAEDFFADDFRFEGTFAPLARASESPIAIACLRLFTLPPLPPRPLRSVPAFRFFIADRTERPAPAPYLRPPDFFAAIADLRVMRVSPSEPRARASAVPRAAHRVGRAMTSRATRIGDLVRPRRTADAAPSTR